MVALVDETDPATLISASAAVSNAPVVSAPVPPDSNVAETTRNVCVSVTSTSLKANDPLSESPVSTPCPVAPATSAASL